MKENLILVTPLQRYIAASMLLQEIPSTCQAALRITKSPWTSCPVWCLKSLMGFNEDDFLQLSGLQHFAFCRRQWALIHVEQQWKDNLRTVEVD